MVLGSHGQGYLPANHTALSQNQAGTWHRQPLEPPGAVVTPAVTQQPVRKPPGSWGSGLGARCTIFSRCRLPARLCWRGPPPATTAATTATPATRLAPPQGRALQCRPPGPALHLPGPAATMPPHLGHRTHPSLLTGSRVSSSWSPLLQGTNGCDIQALSPACPAQVELLGRRAERAFSGKGCGGGACSYFYPCLQLVFTWGVKG